MERYKRASQGGIERGRGPLSGTGHVIANMTRNITHRDALTLKTYIGSIMHWMISILREHTARRTTTVNALATSARAHETGARVQPRYVDKNKVLLLLSIRL